MLKKALFLGGALILATPANAFELPENPHLRHAEAFLQGPVNSGAPPATCPYAVDNGCAATYSATYTNYLGSPTAFSPAFQDPNFYFNHLTSGQLGTGVSDPNYATKLANYIAFAHLDNSNKPYIDYAVGSADPSALRPISNFASDHPGSACSVNAAGTGTRASSFPSQPYLNCVFGGVDGNFDQIQGYDMSNCGGGTGTCMMGVYIQQNPNGTHQINVRMNNDYWTCTSAGTNCKTSGFPGYITIQGVAQYELNYDTFLDGFNDSNGQPSPAVTHHLVNDIRSRREEINGLPQSFTWTYLYIQGLSHDPTQSGKTAAAPDQFISYSVADGFCLAGGSNCHAEWTEMGGFWSAGHIKEYYVGNVTIWHSSNYFIDITSQQYTAGANNGDNWDIKITNNLMIYNKNSSCVNAPPYNANNPCNGGTAGGNAGIINLDNSADVIVTVGNNIEDDEMGIGGYANLSGGGGWGSNTTLTNDGTNSYFTSYGQLDGNDPQAGMWPGQRSWYNHNLTPPGGYLPARMALLTDTIPSTFNQNATITGSWDNGSGTGVSGNQLHLSVPMNLINSTTTPTLTTCTGFPSAATVGCFFLSAGTPGYNTGGALGWPVSDNCGGVLPCNSWTMSTNQSLGTGAKFMTDNLNPIAAIAGDMGCQPGLHRNCGVMAMPGVLQPNLGTLTSPGNYGGCAGVSSLTVIGTTYYANGGSSPFTSPHVITYGHLTPGTGPNLIGQVCTSGYGDTF